MRPKKKSPPKLPFSDEQIRAKAFDIWQSRGGVGGSAEEDWQKAIQQLKAERRPLRILKRGIASGGQAFGNWIGVKDKTLWHWLELFIVPVALAVGAFYLQESAEQRDEQVAEDRARQAVFASYLDQMNTLLIEKGLRNAESKSEVFILAQARTTTALRELDNNRRRLLLEFLIAANLNTPKKKQGLLVGAYFEEVNLSGANLSSVNLSRANLSKTNLSGASLTRANLSDATLFWADLSGASLTRANLREANLYTANLTEANLSDADLTGADLTGANLTGADLTGADLTGADLTGAFLDRTKLDEAIFCDTRLPGASESDLSCKTTDLPD